MQAGAIVLDGDATNQDVLVSARILHARNLVCLLGNDSENLQTAYQAYQISRARKAGKLTTSTAAELLGVSPRQARRLRARFASEGMASVIHANQGRSPANRTNPALVERILSLAGPTGPYHDCNVCHLVDLLADEQLPIARSTLDRLLRQAGLRGAQRAKAAAHRRRR